MVKRRRQIVSRTWILRFRARDKKNLGEIRRGLKKVETRAATERYKKIKAGDRLVFVCGKLHLAKAAKRVRRFRSLVAMFGAINYKKIMPSAKSAEEAKKIYYSYPGYREKIKKLGIVAFLLD